MALPALESAKQPLGSNITRTIPAPVGGWNTQQPLQAMDPRYAIAMDDFIPREGYIEGRAGSHAYQTGLPAEVQTLFVYSGLSVESLFAVSSNKIYDTSSLGGSPSLVFSGLTSNVWQDVMMATSGGNFLVAVSGVDDMLNYDGTTWKKINAVSAPAITGVATNTLETIVTHKRRIWCTQKNSLDAWYLPVDSIAGAMAKFPLGPIFKEGGSLAGIGTWTIDGGTGSDDYLVFATTMGEVAVYQGTDPASAATFALVGVYKIGKPIGKKCFLKYGGDLLFLTDSGVFPMSKALINATIDRKDSISYNIARAFNLAVQSYGSLSGWEMTLSTENNLLIVNIPGVMAGKSVQYAMNTLTNAWCRLTGFPANCFAVYKKQLVFGIQGKTDVAIALSGTQDYTNDITWAVITAFNYLDPKAGEKHVKLIRPQMTVPAPIKAKLAVLTDFQSLPDFQYASMEFALSSGAIALWDVALWDAASWSYNAFTPLQWRTVFSMPALAVAVGFQATTSNGSVQVNAFDLKYTSGNSL